MSADPEVSTSATFAFDAGLSVRHGVERNSLLRGTGKNPAPAAPPSLLFAAPPASAAAVCHITSKRYALPGLAQRRWRPYIVRIEDALV